MTDMATDWDREFNEIAQFYPGSKTPIQRHTNRVLDRTKPFIGLDPTWDEKPRVYVVNGEEMEFFTVGQLGRALGREPGTIRKWENTGILPLPTFYVDGKDGDKRGRRRLYSRAQVEGIIRIAEEEGMFTNRKRPFSETSFKEKVGELFKKTAKD